jgi:hypothetical protein
VLLGKYDFCSVFNEGAILPPYKGSTFRGAFGVALKRVTCALKQRDCVGCPLTHRCVYFQVFENASTGGAGKNTNTPHPFVIEPPEKTKQIFDEGEEFNFSLLLFGFANSYLPYFVYAFEEMGSVGLGRYIEGKRPGFILKRVNSNGKEVYNSADRNVIAGSEVDMPFNAIPVDDDQAIELSIQIETPLRLKFENSLHAELPFHVLVRAMLRRISSLNEHFGSGEPAMDYKGLVNRALQVVTVKSSLQWLDWARFSNRQQTRMQFGGIVGEVTYSGQLTEFLPLVKYCEIVHLGKATTFGLGRIRMINYR